MTHNTRDIVEPWHSPILSDFFDMIYKGDNPLLPETLYPIEDVIIKGSKITIRLSVSLNTSHLGSFELQQALVDFDGYTHSDFDDERGIVSFFLNYG